MTVVETRFTTDIAQMLNGLDQINMRMDKLENTSIRLGGSFDRTFSAATVAAGIGIMVAGTERLVANLDQVISRFNVLQGLDRAGLFFNSQRQVEALMRGLGDMAIRSEAMSQTARLMSAETPLDLKQIQMMGQVARGFMLAGETRSLQEGLHAQELYWTGGQSRMLHRLGIGVDTAFGYRMYAREHQMKLADMTGQDRMQARVDEFFRAASAYNTAGFGADTASTSLQALQAFSANVKDSYIRSLGGSIEMLAKSLGDLSRVDANRIGEVLAVAQPLLGGATLVGTTAMAMGPRIGQMQTQLPGLRASLERAGLRTSFAQEAASAANLREQAARNRHRAGLSGIPDWMRGEGDTLRPLEETPRYLGNQAAVLRNTRLFDKYQTEEALYGLLQSEAMRGKIAEDYHRGLTTVPVAMRGDVPGTIKDFEQTGFGASAMAGSRAARFAADEAAVAQRAMAAEVEAANRSIATQSRLMAGFIGLEVGLSLVTAGWTAYSNAVQAGERATTQFLTSAKAVGPGAADILKMQQAGATPAMLRQQLELGGMDQAGVNSLTAYLRGGDVTNAGFAQEYARAVMEQGREQWIKDATRSNRADAWLRIGNGVAMGGILGFDDLRTGISGLRGAGSQAQAQYDRYIQSVIAGAPNDVEAAMRLQKEIEQAEANEKYQTLQDRLLESQRMAGRYTIAAQRAGFRPDTSYVDQFRRQSDRMLLGFDSSSLTGADLAGFNIQRDAAIDREIAREKEEEVKKLRSGIDAYDKESRARLQVAAIQDQSLGPARRLLDETNTEAAEKANANQLISVYQNALQEGNQALIAEIEARGDLRTAIQRQALASLNLTREMENTISSLRQGIPGMYGGAAADIQAQIGAQTSIEQGLASNNPFLSRLQGIYGQALSLGPQIGQYEQQQSLVEAMTAVMNGEMPATAAKKFGLPDSIASMLLDFAKGTPSGQAQAIAAQRGANWQLQRQLVSGIGGLGGDVLTFRNSLNPVGGLDPKYRDQVNELYRSGLIEQIGPLLGSTFGYAGAEGLINQASLGRLTGAFGGKLPAGDVAGLVSGNKAGVDVIVDQQAVLVLALHDLQAAVERLTVQLGGAPAAGSALTSGEQWGGTIGQPAATGGSFINGLGLPPQPSDSLPQDLKARSTSGFIPDEAPSGFVPARSSDDLFLGIPPSSGVALPEQAYVPGSPMRAARDPRDAGVVLFADLSNRGRRALEGARRSQPWTTASDIWNFQRGRGRRLYGRRAWVPPPGMEPGYDDGSGWSAPPTYYPAGADYGGYPAGTAGIDTGFGTQYYYQEYGGTGLGGGGG